MHVLIPALGAVFGILALVLYAGIAGLFHGWISRNWSLSSDDELFVAAVWPLTLPIAVIIETAKAASRWAR
jgi:ABC-type microcin C transport system permease subunit YejB